MLTSQDVPLAVHDVIFLSHDRSEQYIVNYGGQKSNSKTHRETQYTTWSRSPVSFSHGGDATHKAQ